MPRSISGVAALTQREAWREGPQEGRVPGCWRQRWLPQTLWCVIARVQETPLRGVSWPGGPRPQGPGGFALGQTSLGGGR